MTPRNPSLSKSLFWDIPEGDILNVLSHSKDWVVIRVFEYGSIEEIAEIIKYYGAETVVALLESNRSLRPVTKAMARVFLDLNL